MMKKTKKKGGREGDLDQKKKEKFKEESLSRLQSELEGTSHCKSRTFLSLDLSSPLLFTLVFPHEARVPQERKHFKRPLLMAVEIVQRKQRRQQAHASNNESRNEAWRVVSVEIITQASLMVAREVRLE